MAESATGCKSGGCESSESSSTKGAVDRDSSAAGGDVFHIKRDNFDGITIDSAKVDYSSPEEFASKLEASLCLWRKEGVCGTWIKIATQHSELIPICTKLGFDFHHAQPGYVLLKQWLPEDKPDLTPGYANQYLGCAGFVVNDKNQVLVIQEKHHAKKRWKLPGGLADRGEDVVAAAKREVFEETGIEAEFICIGCFRHWHQFRHGCSDFYFVCVMKALTTEIKACDHEISDCQWMDIEEYMNHPTMTPANRYFAERCVECLQPGAPTIKAEPVLSMNKTFTNQVYSVNPPLVNQHMQRPEES